MPERDEQFLDFLLVAETSVIGTKRNFHFAFLSREIVPVDSGTPRRVRSPAQGRWSAAICSQSFCSASLNFFGIAIWITTKRCPRPVPDVGSPRSRNRNRCPTWVPGGIFR